MTSSPDLVAEHASLLTEQAELRALCMGEWKFMSHQVAKRRQTRLWAIRDRLHVIEHSQAWKRRTT